MAGGREHDQIIAAAAKTALAPIGFWRKGRSRLWLADNGFWLNVVEFQPSAWSTGSYMNACAHWLWGLVDVLSLDQIEGQYRSFVSFAPPARPSSLVMKQAADAATASLWLRSRFETIKTVAACLSDDLTSKPQGAGSDGWPEYNAAVAAGLSGDAVKARSLFEAVLETFEGWETGQKYTPSIEHMKATVSDRVAFRSLLEERVNARRVALGLGPCANVFGV